MIGKSLNSMVTAAHQTPSSQTFIPTQHLCESASSPGARTHRSDLRPSGLSKLYSERSTPLAARRSPRVSAPGTRHTQHQATDAQCTSWSIQQSDRCSEAQQRAIIISIHSGVVIVGTILTRPGRVSARLATAGAAPPTPQSAARRPRPSPPACRSARSPGGNTRAVSELPLTSGVTLG